MVLKETMENYVKAIYSLSRWGEVRPYQLADYLSVSRPTVSTTVRSLVEEGFVCVDDRKEIHLTRKGLKIAKEMTKTLLPAMHARWNMRSVPKVFWL